MSEFVEDISPSNTEKSTSPERTVSAPVETYYSGCALVMSSPAEISLYFGRYILKGLDDGRPGLSQIYEKQVYMTVDEAEKLAEAILKPTFRANLRSELMNFSLPEWCGSGKW